MEHFEKTLKIINDSIRSIHEEEFETLIRDCLDAISRRNKIIVSGLGKNVPICEKFVGTLNSLGIPAAFMHTNSAVHGDLGLVGKNDLVILLTKSGETEESIHLAKLLKKRHCKLWLLSFSRHSTLYREIPNRLIVDLEHEGDEWNLLPNNSTLLNLIVLQEVAMLVAKALQIPIDVLKQNHPGGAIGISLTERDIYGRNKAIAPRPFMDSGFGRNDYQA